MKSIRESTLFKSNKRLSERKSIVGAFTPFDMNIYKDKIWYPHEEMEACVRMYDTNSLAQSAINTMTDFIIGGGIEAVSKDKISQLEATMFLKSLNTSTWLREIVENTLKTGNGYLEVDWQDPEWKIPYKCYALADSSRIYINCDEKGLPKRKKMSDIDPITKQPRVYEVRDEDEYYLLRVADSYINPEAKAYMINYFQGNMLNNFRIRAIPISSRKMIHFKLNIGNTGVIGRSYLASALNDDEMLKQMERSIAVIAKYKAVPKDIIMYGDKDNPATDDEVNEFIVYLEGLDKEESAIVNKPIQRQSLSYSGQDINLSYMIEHVRKKIIAGIVPDFMMGLGNDASAATSQISLISYILAIYSKRHLFLKPIEEYLLKPFLRRKGLQPVELKFGELDFETKSEKTNRVGSMWTQNLVTLNRALELLGEPEIGKKGEIYYMEWQKELGGDQFGFPNFGGGMPSPMGDQIIPNPNDDALPNGETKDNMFSHQNAPNEVPQQKGGEMPFDPYKKKTDVPKLIPKKNLEAMKESVKIIIDSDEKPMGNRGQMKCKKIELKTLIRDFEYLFNKPRTTEIFYKEMEDGLRISFVLRDMLIYCDANYDEIVTLTSNIDVQNITREDIEKTIGAFEDKFLKNAIKEI